MNATRLTCFHCGLTYDPGTLINLCTCGKPLRVDYALSPAIGKDHLLDRHDMWRYAPVLPIPAAAIRSLGEGQTPLIESPLLARQLGVGRLYIKDEALNPTGSFKARGMAVAVAMAKSLGATKLAVPSAGNAGGAMAAYCALHGLEAHVFMPKDVPLTNRLECLIYGAEVTLVDGLIHDCARLVAERKESEGWFDMSTLKEPYRVEGKKTMGYEIAEGLGWSLPDAIVYPTGGGTGLIGMGKAFDEMEAMGWIGPRRPKMFSVQAEGCAPIVRAYDAGVRDAPLIEGAHTVASGLRVPRAIGDFIMLDLIRSTGGAAVSVSDSELLADALELGALTGVCACPEGGACIAATRKLVASGRILPHETVVVFNTGAGTKYQEAIWTEG